MENVISFMKKVIVELQASGSYGTVHVYKSTMNSVIEFRGSERLSFRKLKPEFVKQFEMYLRSKGCSWNTVSTYMRTLRAIYNRAVDSNLVPYIPHLFRHVYTGTRADRKRALDNGEMAQLLGEQIDLTDLPPALERTRDLFVIMFMLRGLPFVDLAYLRKSDLCGNVLAYRRRKTGKQLIVTLTSEALSLIEKNMNNDTRAPYLFSLISSKEGTKEAYREYQLALRSFNHHLVQLAKLLGFDSNLSSYTSRHTWATMAYYCEIHPGIISEAMGHSSITVTETYLKPFKNKKIDEANQKIIDFARRLQNF